jgi:hypothetical protein
MPIMHDTAMIVLNMRLPFFSAIAYLSPFAEKLFLPGEDTQVHAPVDYSR